MTTRDDELIRTVAAAAEKAFGHVVHELKGRIAVLEHESKEQRKRIAALEACAPAPRRPWLLRWLPQ